MLPLLLIFALLLLLVAMLGPPTEVVEVVEAKVKAKIREYSVLHRFLFAFVKSFKSLFANWIRPLDLADRIQTARQFLMLVLFGRGILHG